MADLKQQFIEKYGSDGEILTFFSPGRVNLIGEHIDYNGGWVFPAALTIGITAIVRYRNDTTIRLSSANIEGEYTFDINSSLEYDEKDDWSNYSKGVFNHLKKDGKQLKGMDVLFSSNLPDGAGLSSSAAIEVLTAYIALYGEGEIDRIWLSKFCQKVENEFVGVNCGIMDQFAVAVGKEDQAIKLDCDSLDYELVPVELGEYSLVIMNTNKRRELADSKYNERRAECEEALSLIQSNYSEVKNLCEATMAQIDENVGDAIIYNRARHVVTENKRVLDAVEFLKAGELKRFGELMTASHMSLKNDYEVTGKELDAIVEASLTQSSCIGARMTGAGFGGCAIALVKTQEVNAFAEAVKKEYKSKTGLDADFYPSAIGEGVHIISE